MKKSIILILLLCTGVAVSAQSSSEPDAGKGNVLIHRDALLDTLVQRDIRQNKSQDGVRQKKIDFQELNKFSDLEPYILYRPPYFKLRVGDFRTRLVAYRYLQKITSATTFQEAFIVRDRISIQYDNN
ncbi:MAG: hypothetical protein BRD50_06650 [Bacteroidetes bacterium SW_11_45_7]|nr:MAG: hypothetical protein BRD50_06650 [Bacteroidetes bacterium SW_11_45_7]